MACLTAKEALINAASPAAPSLCPMTDLILPTWSFSEYIVLSFLGKNAFAIASASMGSPTIWNVSVFFLGLVERTR